MNTLLSPEYMYPYYATTVQTDTLYVSQGRVRQQIDCEAVERSANSTVVRSRLVTRATQAKDSVCARRFTLLLICQTRLAHPQHHLRSGRLGRSLWIVASPVRFFAIGSVDSVGYAL